MHKDMEQRLAALEERIGITFKKRGLLLEAVTHRSYLNEVRNHPVQHNEMLEFLGDAVLELAVTEYLFKRFHGNENEGTCTNLRAALVNAKTCAKLAYEIGLERCLLMSHGESKDKDTKAREYIMANAFEALLGAVHLDQGIGTSRMLVDSLVISRFSEIVSSHSDHKSEFQELTQERFGITPHYRLVRRTGPDNAPLFVIAAVLRDLHVGEAKGASKLEAEQLAAKTALQTISSWEGRLVKRG